MVLSLPTAVPLSPMAHASVSGRISVRRQRCDATGVQDPSTWEISLVTRGTGRVRLGDEVFPLQPGLLTVASAHLVRAWMPQSAATMWVCVLGDEVLRSSAWLGGVTDQLASASPRAVVVPHRRQVDDLFRRLLGEAGSASLTGHHEMMQALLLELLTLCLRELTRSGLGRSEAVPSELVAEIIAYVERRFTEPIDRTSIGRAVGLAPATVGRLFRAECGMTIAEFVRRRRVEHAIELLRTSDLKASQICRLSGFTSYRTFARSLRDTAGAGPDMVRRRGADEI